jgi:hypothetical protein
MFRASRRVFASVLTLAAAFAAGVAFDAAFHREAHAQSLTTSTIYVPEAGLVFRASDGTPIARLSRDAHGGTFELFDDRHEVGGARPSTELRPNPYQDDEGDPWVKPELRPRAPEKRPGPGF